MSEDAQRDNFIRGMSSRMMNQQVGQLHQDVSAYEAGLIPPIPEPPQTIVIECNKVQGVDDGDALRTNAWTNTFPPIKLKKGDVISVNSAFLSTRGAGDLLQFDESNNKTRILFEYYATNDNANLKKPDYNIKGNEVAAGTTNAYTYDPANFLSCYPANYRPMRLKRLAETYKTIADFTNPTPAIPEDTTPDSAMPFYSTTKEKYWGYKNSTDFVLDAVEDKYVDGMFRPPDVTMREFMTHIKPSGADFDPTDEPFFGIGLDKLSVWYISTPMSKLGPCSDNATMRIYFAYGTDADFAGNEKEQQKARRDDTYKLLRALRVGEVIQFKQPAGIFSESAEEYVHFNSTSGAMMAMKGSNVFYCDGYQTLGDGITIGGNVVDRFIQMGHQGSNKYYDMSVRGVMGQFMRITKINIGNINNANKLGQDQEIIHTYAEATNGNPFEFLPWIEVSCDKGISLAWGNPNYEHPEGIPSVSGPKLGGNQGPDQIVSRFTSTTGKMMVRCWTAGKTKNLTRKLKNTNTATTQKTDLGVCALGLYPTNPQFNKGKELQEDFYVAFRPYYQSPATANSPTDNMKNSYTMSLVEDELPIGETNRNDYTNALGITGTNPTIVSHNYNFSNLNLDGSLNTDKDGYDIVTDGVYQGARGPRNWSDAFGYGAEGYTKPVQDIKRIAMYNQGQEWWNDTLNLADNTTGTGGFYTSNWSGTYEGSIGRHQSTLNSNTDLYLKNDKDKNMIFYFTENITADPNGAYDGSAYPSWDFASYASKPASCANGSYNFLIGIKNMVKSSYYGNAAGIPLQTKPYDGMWYGYSTMAKVGTGVGYIMPATSNGNGPDTGVGDLRYPVSQMNTEVYARFTNTAGQTEVMLIKFLPYVIERTTNYNDMASMNSGSQGASFQPSVVQGTTITTSCAVGWVILQRDVENTGTYAFGGSLRSTDTKEREYNPLAMSNAWDGNRTKDYFEILNGFANCEHQFQFNSTGRDLLPIGPQNFTDNGWYGDNFGGNTLGTKCGGDFYLCKHANMPVKEDDNILRMVDNTLRCSDLCLRVGQPTRSKDGSASHLGRLSWVTHYDYMDLSLDGEKVYFSATDIANLITKQLHAPADLYKSWKFDTQEGGGRYEGGYWKNTAGKYPLNSLFRMIHGPSEDADGSANTQDGGTGMLTGKYHDGDFCFELDMTGEVITNGINSYGWCGGKLLGFHDGQVAGVDIMPPASGKHRVWIPNNSSIINTAPTTDSYNVRGYAGVETPTKGFVRTLMDQADYRTAQIGDNVNYKQDATFGPMFIGTNNAQLNFNTDVSRFEWKFLHQSVYSEFASSSDGATSGGNVVAKIWGQSIQGYDNWDRYGGVNIVNWCANAVVRGTYSVRRESTGTDPLTIRDTIGEAFMNKLGFSSNWMTDNAGSKDYDDVADYEYSTAYEPLGSTRSDFDVSESRPYTQTNTLINQVRGPEGEFRSGFQTPPTQNTGNHNPPVDNTADKQSQLNYLQNDTTKISLGGRQVDKTARIAYDGADPFGIEVTASTSGAGATGNVIIKELGATLGYGMVNTLSTPQAVIYKKTAIKSGDAGYQSEGIKVPTDLNLDDVKFPNYEIEVDSNSLLADELPKKTLIGYFLIMSDLIDKHEFIGSANGGQPLKCIGILSKNYENNDFYYSFQSPVEFHVKQDRSISHIRTEIVQPDLKDPAGLDYNSSIIYTIVRAQSLPEPDVPPISVQQALDYETMEQMSGMLGVDMSLFDPQSNVGQMGLGNGAGGAGLNQLRANLVSAVLNPNQNSASKIAQTESSMNSLVSRMPLHERARAILNAGMGDASEALKPSPQQAQMEGLGIAEPQSLEPTPYLSEDQLQIEAFNMVKGKRPAREASDSAFGGSEASFDALGGIGPGGQAPFDATADDDDIRSIRSAMTKDNELYSLIDPSEVPQSPSELFASSAHNTRMGASKGLQAVSLPEFFSKYMSVANDATRQLYRNESNQYGFSVDNPNVWRLGILKTWAGEKNDFDWGQGLYKKIGATLNLEARSKITQARSRYEALDRPTQKIQRAKELEDIKQRGEDPTSLVIPEPEFGQESLIKRISRISHDDRRTRPDEKQSNATDFTNQNPYDLRTWSQGNLQAYQADLHHGVPVSARNSDNKLSSGGVKYLRDEQKRRKDGNKRPLQIRQDTGDYKNAGEAPKGYQPHQKHRIPHISTGVTSIFLANAPKGKSPKKVKFRNPKEPIKGDHEIKWTDGYIKGHALEGGYKQNEFASHENAVKTAKAHKGKVKGITKYQKGGQDYWTLRGGNTITPKSTRGEKSYLFKDQHHSKPAPVMPPPPPTSAPPPKPQIQDSA